MNTDDYERNFILDSIKNNMANISNLKSKLVIISQIQVYYVVDGQHERLILKKK